jgi:hypothetical protein
MTEEPSLRKAINAEGKFAQNTKSAVSHKMPLKMKFYYKHFIL